MDRKNIILLVAVLVIGFAMLLGSVLLLFNRSNNDKPEETQPTEPVVTLPNLNGEEITIPTEDVKDQLEDIDKTGFDSQTTYWIEKLKTVTNVEEALNKGLTLEYLCEKYFYEEYKEYKNTMLLGNEQNPEYPEEKVEELYQYCISKAQTLNFHDIAQTIKTLLNEYKFTQPYNYKICNLYSDAVALQYFDDMTSAAKVECVSKLKTPEIMLIAAVNLGYKEQCCMYANKNSICMTAGTKVLIKNVENITISPNPTDSDGKLMQKYFGNNISDLKVTKITFTVNFDLSGFEPADFDTYFETSEMIEVEDDSFCIFDENGDVIHYLGRYSKEELEQLKMNNPEYSETIDKELARRKNKTNNQTNSESGTTDENMDDNFVGMANPEAENTKTYNMEDFERYKGTTYEIYIPQYVTHNRNYNRIYMIKQTSNLDLPCCYTIYYYKTLYANNTTFKNFVYKNQWSWNVDNENLADEIAGDHAG